MGKGEMGRVEFDISRFECKQGVVFADADRLARVEGGTALSDDDLARENVLVCRHCQLIMLSSRAFPAPLLDYYG